MTTGFSVLARNFSVRAGVDAHIYVNRLQYALRSLLNVISRPNFLPTEAQVEEAMSPLTSVDQSVYGVLYLSSLMLTVFYGITCMQT